MTQQPLSPPAAISRADAAGAASTSAPRRKLSARRSLETDIAAENICQSISCAVRLRAWFRNRSPVTG